MSVSSWIPTASVSYIGNSYLHRVSKLVFLGFLDHLKDHLTLISVSNSLGEDDHIAPLSAFRSMQSGCSRRCRDTVHHGRCGVFHLRVPAWFETYGEDVTWQGPLASVPSARRAASSPHDEGLE